MCGFQQSHDSIGYYFEGIFWYRTQGLGHVYQKPYPDYYDQLPYPRGCRVPGFSKFSGEDGKITLEHVSQAILQCGEACANDALK
jgi:hypothetical protein